MVSKGAWMCPVSVHSDIALMVSGGRMGYTLCLDGIVHVL